MVEKYIISPASRREDGLWNLDIDAAPLADTFEAKEKSVVYIPAGGKGDNHKHPRTEATVGIGVDLVMIWQDESGINHEEQMTDPENIFLFVINSLATHAIMNKGSEPATLLEFANEVQHSVEPVELV